MAQVEKSMSIYRCNTCRYGWGHQGAICDRLDCKGVCVKPIITAKDKKGVKKTRKLVRLMAQLSLLIKKMHLFMVGHVNNLFDEDEEE